MGDLVAGTTGVRNSVCEDQMAPSSLFVECREYGQASEVSETCQEHEICHPGHTSKGLSDGQPEVLSLPFSILANNHFPRLSPFLLPESGQLPPAPATTV